MALPINSNKSEQTGSLTSSNLIVWQGPDIPCLNLCKGDSISTVVYKLATELCDLLEQVDIKTFDLTCFNPICPTPKNFHELFQFVLDKICACCGGSSPEGTGASASDSSASGAAEASASASSTDGSSIVTVATCFYRTDEFGDTITTMTVSEYARAIGVRVCIITNQIANINLILGQHTDQINYIFDNFTPQPPIPLPTFLSTCLTDKIPSIPVGGVPIAQMVSSLEEAFCELRTVTGMPSELLNSVLKQCVNLDTSPALNLPGNNMGSLPGWVLSSGYSTLANSINNMWITICDMRAAITSIQLTCCPQGCEGLVISLQTTFTSPNLSLFWEGDATGFQDCSPAGSFITITDVYGNTYTTHIPIVPYVNSPYIMDLSSTPLNLGTNLSISINACFKKISDGTTCERCIEASVINQSACPALSLDADSSNINYNFNNTVVGAVTYDVILKLAGSTLDTHTIVTSTVGPITGTFIDLLPDTTYTISIIITISGEVTNTCPVGVITTGPLECNPPTEVSAEALTELI